ncbi:tetratricopeptide repeat protein [Salidesulfovibrio onnuriiensis]|uniref:tetratricopeptide repeat protein n=1 Tax=Salidesulfovibrio onnuriiensis TaxID=2583823 RepID=UPI0011C83F21|nr:tetratricopeptide repeat protein [Salidesulfovibrio onnuriiensis]
MEKKIEWYQEVLSLEPGSKVFFPLAKLFAETGNTEDAVKTLRLGLDRHPDFLEARMFLVQLLTDLGREDEVHDQLRHVVDPLGEYPAFWRAWARSIPEDKRDLSVFLMLVAANISGEDIRWTDVVFEGLSSLSDRLVGAPLPPPCECKPRPPRRVAPISPDLEYDGVVERDEEIVLDGGNLRTRTMAELLASQGDIRGALDIFRELLELSPAEGKPALQERIRELETNLGREEGGDDKGDPFSVHAKNRLISTLETLASRFEARIRS